MQAMTIPVVSYSVLTQYLQHTYINYIASLIYHVGSYNS